MIDKSILVLAVGSGSLAGLTWLSVLDQVARVGASTAAAVLAVLGIIRWFQTRGKK